MGILLFVLPCVRSFSFFPDFSSKISPQPLTIETSNLVYRLTMTCCIVGLKIGLLLFVLLCICSFFFSYHIFVKDISTTVQDRNFKFGIQVYNNRLYRGLENGPSPICSSVLFFFLSRFFVKDISTTVLDRNFKFGIQVHNDKLYRRIENGPSKICSFLYLFFFLSLQIFRQRYLHNRFRSKLQFWYRGSHREVVLWDCKWTFSYFSYTG